MACHMLRWPELRNRRAKAAERFVLRGFKVFPLHAFELDADGVVVAVVTAPVARNPSMPGALLCADKLPQLTTAPDVEMRRHLQTFHLLEVGVLVPVQLVRKQALHLVAAVLAWRQAD